eukprot:TRINITY_DN852_c0_g2_i1.p1 TRINITY_DN852_c0_g2~~TRINITY_DN852_c0_g2_i1.p1  ORF type:complete len:450 (-),score=190.83 TRINITY_DN852_c0_g2_i1:89-1438(-)
MSDLLIKKKEVDLLESAKEEIAKSEALANQNRLNAAIENLLTFEKQSRNAGDFISTSEIAIAIVRICFSKQEWKELENNLVLISKRRGQEKQVVRKMVQEAIDLIEKSENLDIKVLVQLYKCLRTITEGKIYVENERARLTRKLAAIKKSKGKIAKASALLQEIQVETYGSMDKREKVDFLLEQIQYCLENNDFVRALIISRKINKKVLSEENLQDLKVRFYNYMIQYYLHEDNFIETARCFQALVDTNIIKTNRQQLDLHMKLLISFIILSPHDAEQHDLLNRINLDKHLNVLPVYKKIIDKFLAIELIFWKQFLNEFQPELNQLSFFDEKVSAKQSTHLWSELHKRVVAHNLRVISTYYSRISSTRLATLLDLNADETERALSDLVVTKTIFARIERPNGIITFQKSKNANDLLNDWSANLSTLLDVLEHTCHLVERETTVYAVNGK